MSPATYAAGAVLLSALWGALTNQHYSWIALGTAALGSCLPHACERQWLTQRVGSQTLTHSLVGMLGCGLLLSPLLICHRAVFWTTLSAGYLSHLFLDAASDRGVPLFYPGRARAVIPRHPLSRVPPGSPRESRLRGWLLGLWIAALPLNALGVRGLLHRFLPVIQFAVEDYETAAGQNHRILADFAGCFTASQRPVSGVWEAIGVSGSNALLVLDPSGRVHKLGRHSTDAICPSRIRVFRGKPIRVEVREMNLKHQPLGILLRDLPQDAEVFLTGWAVLEEPVLLNYSEEEFHTVTISDRKLQFSHAPLSEISRQRLLGMEVLRGDLLIRIVRQTPPPDDGRRRTAGLPLFSRV